MAVPKLLSPFEIVCECQERELFDTRADFRTLVKSMEMVTPEDQGYWEKLYIGFKECEEPTEGIFSGCRFEYKATVDPDWVLLQAGYHSVIVAYFSESDDFTIYVSGDEALTAVQSLAGHPVCRWFG